MCVRTKDRAPRFVWRDCPECEGTGLYEVSSLSDCPHCQGRGQVRRPVSPSEKGNTNLVMRPKSTSKDDDHHALKARFRWKIRPDLKTVGTGTKGMGSLCGCPVRVQTEPVHGDPKRGFRVLTRVTLPDGTIIFRSSSSYDWHVVRGGGRKALRWGLGLIRRILTNYTLSTSKLA